MARPPIARRALLDAARAELIENGRVEDLSSVVKRAGVSTGAVYHHFGSKTGLLAAVYSEFFDGSEAALRTADHSCGDWIQREHHRTRAMVEYYFDNALTEVIMRTGVEHPAIAELEAAYLARVAEGAVRNLRDGQRCGALSPDLDVELVAAFLVGGLRSALATMVGRTPRPTIHTAVGRLWQFVTATVRIPPSGSHQ
ncbi:TetR/AcrR family transcriptional regulator [Nocardia sp. CNY236]|uniref:TetR/AcrR family transcriptional regulator n=1 Tax=Nocardia sp. CNY236 TaxID=1169152 RepID=UPI00042884D0|nr:TetR/AcrR family transcriptional regulator [Nocardia sp. CNY236]